MKKKVIIIIPARLASTRLPNKPLAMIEGNTMIQRVYEQALKANLGDVIIATDGEKIAEEINKFLIVNAAINFCYTSVALFNINIYI